MRQRRLGAAAALGVSALMGLLFGCDEANRPEPPARLPPGIVEGATDPVRWSLEQAAHLLLDRPPEDRRGRPAEAAQAIALVEYLTTAFQDGRYADASRITRLLREGRGAMRTALGVAEDTAPQAGVDAWLAASDALRHGDEPAADRALEEVAAPSGPRPAAAAAARLELPGPLRRALRETREAVRREMQSDGA